MADYPSMPLWIGDYIRDTRHLSCEEHGAYLQLLMAMWITRGPLEMDDARLARICSLPLKKWRQMSPTVLAFFQVERLPNGACRIESTRLEKERLYLSELSAVRAKAGKRGGEAKSLKFHKVGVANATRAKTKSW